MMRVGFGYDSHRLVDGRKLILGGVEVSHEKGLLGHSDADALLHAIGDAILGAAGERDIGTHFPDADAAWKDVASRTILEKIRDMAAQKGYKVCNVDATLLLERPKILPYVGEMVKTIGQILSLPGGSVSVKAKTNEGMGFIGRGEGIAVFAVVTLMKSAFHEKD